MAGEEELYDGSPKRLTQEELDRHVARLTAPPRPLEVRDPFPVCPTTHLPQSEIDKMTERLYTQALEQKKASLDELEKRFDGGDSVHRTRDEPLTEDQLQGTVDRLYTQSVEKKKRTLEETRQRYEGPKPEPKSVPVNDFVQHMYYDRIEAKKKTEAKLYEKYIVSTEIRSGKISRDQLAASAERLSSKN